MTIAANQSIYNRLIPLCNRKPSWLPYQHQALLAGVAMGTGSSLLLTGGHTNPKYPVTAGSHMIFSNNLGASSSGPASSGYCDPISAGYT